MFYMKEQVEEILEIIGTFPPNESQRIHLYLSKSVIQLAKQLLNILGPENVAFGLRRFDVIDCDAGKNAPVQRCALGYSVLAHAAMMVRRCCLTCG